MSDLRVRHWASAALAATLLLTGCTSDRSDSEQDEWGRVDTATVAPDGRHIALSISIGDTEKVTETKAIEEHSKVTIEIRVRDTDRGPGIRAGGNVRRKIDIMLKDPLGKRELVNHDGSPIDTENNPS